MNTIRTLSLLALFLLSASACQDRNQAPAAPREKITIAATSHQPHTTLIHVAANKGYFSEEGLDATIQLHNYGKLALASMLEGKADLGASAETPVMFAIMAGKKIAVHATIESSGENEGVLGRKDRGIRTLSDLRGKQIGVTLGTSAEFFLDAMLTSAGLDQSDVSIAPLTPDKMPTALREGAVDAVAVWNFPLLEMRNETGSNGVIFSDKTIYTEFFCLSSTQQYARSHPETLRKVMKALVKAEAFISNNPQESQKILAAAIDIDISKIAQIWGIFHFEAALNQSLLIILEDEARWAMNRKLVTTTGMPVFAEYLYPDALAAVKPSAVRLIR